MRRRISPLTITLLNSLLTPRKFPPTPRSSFLHRVVAAMHPSRSYLHILSAAIIVTLLLIYYFAFLPFVTVGSSDDAGGYKQKKTVLGSRPPRCINKCLACKPCLPTLVVQGHQVINMTSSSRDDNDGYYLLVWKCRCGNKLYQP